jgi:hypothetical protein
MHEMESKKGSTELLKNARAEYYQIRAGKLVEALTKRNMDQAGNRTSNLLFGPENVIVVAGMNKVVNNEQDAINRVRNYVCPFHSVNINTNMNEKYTPCTKTGQCHDCLSKDTTCGHTVITRFSYFPNRIKVILVGEDLGI